MSEKCDFFAIRGIINLILIFYNQTFSVVKMFNKDKIRLPILIYLLE